MKRTGKIAFMVFGVLVVLAAVAVTFTIGWRPVLGPRARPLTDRKFEVTPERLGRGRLLVEVTGCLGCHSPHHWELHGGPRVAGMDGSGAEMPFEGLPGRLVASNLTPDKETGAGNWTDDQWARAIREGIGHDGRALFPMMPYPSLRHLSDEDLASIVVYLKTLPAVRNELPRTELAFPVSHLIRSVPEPVLGPVKAPDPSNRLKYGEYLVTIGSCQDCHSPADSRGARIEGLAFAGGMMLTGPWGSVAASNLTPDASGISYYDEELFLQAMRTGYVRARQLSAIMPFLEYSHFSDDDLKAMFAYLQTVRPVKHTVDNTEPPTACRICGGRHGGGNRN